MSAQLSEWPKSSRENELSEKPVTFTWLTGTLLGIVVLGGSSWMTVTYNKISILENNDVQKTVRIAEILGEQRSQGNQLDRIERKLDLLSGMDVPKYRKSNDTKEQL